MGVESRRKVKGKRVKEKKWREMRRGEEGGGGTLVRRKGGGRRKEGRKEGRRRMREEERGVFEVMVQDFICVYTSVRSLQYIFYICICVREPTRNLYCNTLIKVTYILIKATSYSEAFAEKGKRREVEGRVGYV